MTYRLENGQKIACSRYLKKSVGIENDLLREFEPKKTHSDKTYPSPQKGFLVKD